MPTTEGLESLENWCDNVQMNAQDIRKLANCILAELEQGDEEETGEE